MSIFVLTGAKVSSSFSENNIHLAATAMLNMDTLGLKLLRFNAQKILNDPN